MKLVSIDAGPFKCDGGAFFGVIPKVLWSRKYQCDENNFCQATMRCLLVDLGEKIILIDTGAGEKYSEKYARNNGISNQDILKTSLVKSGYCEESITDVLFTHLHWDHSCGAVLCEDGEYVLRFPNARHWVSNRQLEHSKVSNIREQAAYHIDEILFLQEKGKLLTTDFWSNVWDRNEIELFECDGHTVGNIVPIINYKGQKLAFSGDFIPTSAHIPLLWIASYDLYPIKTMSEKEYFLKRVIEENILIYFEHDAYTEVASVKRGKKDYEIDQTFLLNEL